MVALRFGIGGGGAIWSWNQKFEPKFRLRSALDGAHFPAGKNLQHD